MKTVAEVENWWTSERKRIVAKVDELLRWCDALEARLTAAKTIATHLLDATMCRVPERDEVHPRKMAA